MDFHFRCVCGLSIVCCFFSSFAFPPPVNIHPNPDHHIHPSYASPFLPPPSPPLPPGLRRAAAASASLAFWTAALLIHADESSVTTFRPPGRLTCGGSIGVPGLALGSAVVAAGCLFVAGGVVEQVSDEMKTRDDRSCVCKISSQLHQSIHSIPFSTDLGFRGLGTRLTLLRERRRERRPRRRYLRGLPLRAGRAPAGEEGGGVDGVKELVGRGEQRLLLLGGRLCMWRVCVCACGGWMDGGWIFFCWGVRVWGVEEGSGSTIEGIRSRGSAPGTRERT